MAVSATKTPTQIHATSLPSHNLQSNMVLKWRGRTRKHENWNCALISMVSKIVYPDRNFLLIDSSSYSTKSSKWAIHLLRKQSCRYSRERSDSQARYLVALRKCFTMFRALLPLGYTLIKSPTRIIKFNRLLKITVSLD